MVLFLFVIMLVNLDAEAKQKPFTGQKWIALGCVVFLAVEALLFVRVGAGRFHLGPPGSAAAPEGIGNAELISRALFSDYLLPFELASILLLVAIIGAVVMAKK